MEHHAISLGEVKGATHVADMWGPTKEEAKVQMRSFDSLLRNKHQLLVVHYKDDNPQRREFTALLATWATQNSTPPRLYNLLNNNCENFATYCRTLRWAPVDKGVSMRVLFNNVDYDVQPNHFK